MKQNKITKNKIQQHSANKRFHFPKYTHKLKVRQWKNIFQANGNQRTGEAILNTG